MDPAPLVALKAKLGQDLQGDAVQVVADYFQVVDPSVGSLMNFTDPPPAPNSFTSTSIRSTGGRDTDLDIQYYNAWKSNPVIPSASADFASLFALFPSTDQLQGLVAALS